jgi:monofunctional biosynthetic peptidoglycan transglycosylase
MKNSLKLFMLILLNLFVNSTGLARQMSEKEKTLEHMVINFKVAENRDNWLIINDGVMGGLSRSEIVFSDSGTAIFQGTVSLENNGGFASVRTTSLSENLDEYNGLSLRIFGDGKNYQLRLRTNDRFDGISYRHHFKTKPDTWMTTFIPFSNFVPVFRGRIIKDAEPLVPDKIEQIGFLIADKQAGAFRLEIEWIKAAKN